MRAAAGGLAITLCNSRRRRYTSAPAVREGAWPLKPGAANPVAVAPVPTYLIAADEDGEQPTAFSRRNLDSASLRLCGPGLREGDAAEPSEWSR